MILSCVCSRGGELTAPRFRAVEIDQKVEIGYGVCVADVDGDGKPDILLADKKQIVWYRNPTWEKFVIAQDLTVQDDVCIAAADIDGDGKAEIAVGAGWNPGDTVNSGAVFYLVPPSDRTQKWEPMELSHEPTVHRMRWIRNDAGGFELVVVPLHGRGNQNAAGAGVKILGYTKPANPREPWKTEIINADLHTTHNFQSVQWTGKTATELLVASKEGVFHLVPDKAEWKSSPLAGVAVGQGAGEVRTGKLPGGKRFVVTIEPMHGNELAEYTELPKSDGNASWVRHSLDASLKEGHALACGDLMGAGFDQVVVGWRGKNQEGKVGVKLFWPLDPEGEKWGQATVDDDTVACEDLCLADVNGDGKLDLILAGRATHNLKVLFNEGMQAKSR